MQANTHNKCKHNKCKITLERFLNIDKYKNLQFREFLFKRLYEFSLGVFCKESSVMFMSYVPPTKAGILYHKVHFNINSCVTAGNQVFEGCINSILLLTASKI